MSASPKLLPHAFNASSEEVHFACSRTECVLTIHQIWAHLGDFAV